jgi:hypothetical protein
MDDFEGQPAPQSDPTAGAPPPERATPEQWTQPPVFEPASADAALPLTAQVRTPSRPPRLRLLTAVVATIAVLVTAIGVLAFTASSAGSSPTLAYTPATSAEYMEFRLDLPGDQRDQLARFLAHFPGFADTTILERKLSDAFDRLTGDATKGRYSYSGDFAPWAAGPVAFVVLSMPSPSTASTPSAVLASEHIAVLVAVKDAAKAQVELDKLKNDVVAGGWTASSSDVQGTTVWTLADATSDTPLSYALAPDMLMVTLRRDDIGALLDVKAGRTSGLGSSTAYRNAADGAPADRLASMYVDTKAALSNGLAVGPLASLLPSGTLENLPDAAFGTFRAESDKLILDVRYPGAGTAKVRSSAIVDHVPGTAIAYAEVHDVGKGIAAVVTELKALPQVQDQLGSLSQVEGVLGGDVESFVSWIGDVGVVVESPRAVGQVPPVGIVATVTDEAAAKAKLAQLRNLIALGGASAGLSVTDAEHNGVTITTISGSPGGSIGGPATGMSLSGSVSFAVAGGRFILGVGPDFVPEVLDLQASDSLARAPGFSDALKAAGGPDSAGLLYLDVRSIRAAVEAAIPPAQRDAYDTNTRPYLAPIDRVVGLIGANGSTLFTRIVVTVSTP